MDTTGVDVTKIRINAIVGYKLKDSDMSNSPNKVWLGKVTFFSNEALIVEMLENGYKGLEETIIYSQIVAIEC